MPVETETIWIPGESEKRPLGIKDRRPARAAPDVLKKL